MIDINWIRNNPILFDNALLNRNMKPLSEIIISLDEERRSRITALQKLQQEKNEIAKKISMIADKKSEEFKEALTYASKIKEDIAEAEEYLNSDNELENLLENIPNIPDETVPVGKDESENLEIKKFGTIKNISNPKHHYEIGEELGLMDFETAAKMSGARFVMLKQDLAKLERSLANFMLDCHITEYGYQEISPPILVRDNAMYGVGQLPKFAEDSFATTNGYRLIPTAEVSLTNIVADKILSEEELPLRFTAHTPCFRSEAGSAGKDTRGMIRLHQFSKVELVSIVTPEKSKDEHERMLSAAENILQKLDLSYRVVTLCTGDIGFGSSKTYDIEVWLPAQNCYREISSCSNCTDFQSRRMKARFKRDKENIFLHTLNGSGLAIGRTIVAILENYQNEDGSVYIPDALHSYMNKKIIEKII